MGATASGSAFQSRQATKQLGSSSAAKAAETRAPAFMRASLEWSSAHRALTQSFSTDSRLPRAVRLGPAVRDARESLSGKLQGSSPQKCQCVLAQAVQRVSLPECDHSKAGEALAGAGAPDSVLSADTPIAAKVAALLSAGTRACRRLVLSHELISRLPS